MKSGEAENAAISGDVGSGDRVWSGGVVSASRDAADAGRQYANAASGGDDDRQARQMRRRGASVRSDAGENLQSEKRQVLLRYRGHLSLTGRLARWLRGHPAV